MADAYCGPSNALQSFQKHTQADRSLQQDRLASRRSPLEGFRSFEPNAGVLDPEFEAFQASQPGPLPFAEPPGLHLPQSLNQRGKQPAFGGPVDWASDFQRLHLSPSPHQQQFASPPPQLQTARADQSVRTGASYNQSLYAPSMSNMQNYSPYGQTLGGFGGYNNGMMQQHAPMQASAESSMQVDQFDEEAFARAFDAAQEEMLSQEAAVSQRDMQQETQLGEEELDDVMADGRPMMDITDADLLRRIPTNEMEEAIEQQQAADNDDLARTASELLDKVQNNQTEKFQNSAFLGLMRRLRDHEVKVEGDKMVETGTSSTPAAPSQGSSEQVDASVPQAVYTSWRQRAPVLSGVSVEPQNDGEEVVKLLDEPSTLDQDPEFTMTSPFYDEEHAQISSQDLLQGYRDDLAGEGLRPLTAEEQAMEDEYL